MSVKTIANQSSQVAGSGVKFIFDKSFKSKKALSIYHPCSFPKVDFSSSYMPEDYTKDIAMTHRYKAIGNAFNVDVVAHILSNIEVV